MKHRPSPTHRSKAKASQQANFDTTTLMTLLERIPHPISIDEILRYTKTARREKHAIRAALEQLEAKNVIIRLGSGTRLAWALASHAKTLQGILHIQRGGFGFVTPSVANEGSKDIFIPENALNGAWHGDIVELRTTRQPKDISQRVEGHIIRVIQRHTNTLIVQAIHKQNKYGRFFRPVDTRYDFELVVDISEFENPINDNDLISVTDITCISENEKIWSAKIAQILGQENDVATQERLVKLNHHIATEFPPDVIVEAEYIDTSTSLETILLDDPNCTDLTQFPFVTIDGEDARDFDDAILVQQQGDSWELWVAIADVSRYVRYNSALDKEAQQRTTSAYFPMSVEPMLPEALSNNLCSLVPYKTRAVLVAHVSISQDGTCTKAHFMPAAIRSQARLTYTNVQYALDDKLDLIHAQEQAIITPHISMLKRAMRLAETLQTRRQSRGSLELDIPEPQVIVDEKGKIQDIVHCERLEAHKLIEACMLAANEAVATFLTSKNIPFPYRIHPEPDPERLETLFKFLHTTHLIQDIPKKATAEALSALLIQTKNDCDASTTALVHHMILRTMMQANYSPELGAHFGLASPCYCHFTSPIRRYADLLVHRALKYALGDTSLPVLADQKLTALCDMCNKQERIVIEAEREIMRRLACLFLQGREGEVFDGIISSIVHFGFFVELENMPIEGLISVESLLDDYYTHDSGRQTLVGERTGRIFALGNRLRVRLIDININRLRINFAVEELVDISAKQQNRRKGRGGMTTRKHKKHR